MADYLKQQKNASLYSAFNENEWVGMKKTDMFCNSKPELFTAQMLCCI